MNVLVINTDSDPVMSEMLKFLLNNEEFEFIVILNLATNATTPVKLPIDFDYSERILVFDINSIERKLVKNQLEEIFTKCQIFSLIIYRETIPKITLENFDSLNIPEFQNIFLNELQEKINLFQFLIQELKNLKLDLEVKVLVLVPDIAQTKLITENIAESILFSSYHMITTAIADEFIDYNINCNAVVQTSNFLETIYWLLSKKSNFPHGKLFQDKNVIDW